MEHITIHQWLPLKKETRQKLKEIFLIPATGMVEVVTDEYGKSTIKLDGHNNADLQVVTVEKLVDFLGTAAVNETIFDLWKRVVEKIETPEVLPDVSVLKVEIGGDTETLPAFPMNTADNQLKCDLCPYQNGNKRALTMHKISKHKRMKVA